MSAPMNEILAAFDEETDEPVVEQEELPAEEEETTEAEPDDEEETEEAEEIEEADEEEEAEEEAEEPGEETEEEVEAEQDPAVQAFLARYGGDVDRALRGAVELEVVLGRQSAEVNAARQRTAELEREIAQLQAFAGNEGFLTEEQAAWVEQAVASGNPRPFIQGALQEGEIGLARAVLREWSRESPYDAMRLAGVVERAAQPPAETVDGPINHSALVQVFLQNFPEADAYRDDMQKLLGELGPTHPTVADALSNDLDRAWSGLTNLYEIARRSSATVREAKETVKRRQRKAAEDARADAVVSSAETSRAAQERARSVTVTPGLTLAQLDEAFEAASK